MGLGGLVASFVAWGKCGSCCLADLSDHGLKERDGGKKMSCRYVVSTSDSGLEHSGTDSETVIMIGFWFWFQFWIGG